MRAMSLLASNSAGRSAPKSRLKARSPDTFDGTDPSKLETFEFQCTSYISLRKDDFEEEETQVLWAISHLKGAPLDYFQSELSSAAGAKPEWADSWDEFVQVLQDNFGLRDPVVDAINAVENL